MTIKTGAALSIDFDIKNECRITIKDDRDSVEAVSDLSQGQLKSIHKKLRAELDEFRNGFGEIKQESLSHVLKHLLQLQRRGRLILLELFKNQSDALSKTVEMCNRACRDWRSTQTSPLISVRTSLGSGIPFEMLPLLELETPGEFKGDLVRVARSFLSFSAILMRNVGAPLPDTDRLLASPRLPIKMFHYKGLPGVDRTRVLLQTNPLIDLDSSWPDAGVPKDSGGFGGELARHLWEPDKSFSGGARRPPDQICFFACHCDTTAEFHGDYKLTLHTGEGWFNQGEREVDLDTLTDKLSNLRLQGASRRTRALVFLNACGTAAVDPGGTGSFPDLFLKRDLGFLGFIGTEATIPDAFAAAFAQSFFEYLLSGMEIGRVLHASRWKFLRDYHNPLGILYSLYAQPEICVRRIEGPVEAGEHAS